MSPPEAADHDEYVDLTCTVEHPTIGPCNLPADHRGAHRVTRVIAAKEFHYFGTNEPGYDTVTAAPLGVQPPDHVHNFDRILFGGGMACTICDDVEAAPSTTRDPS